MPPHLDDHDLGLVHDLGVLERRLVGRRRALGWLALGGGAALLSGCGGGGSSSSTASVSSDAAANTTTDTTANTTGTSTGSTTTTTTTASGGACVADPTETSGPFPSDGTNLANGVLSNSLTTSGIVRNDIRTSFGGDSGTAPGVTLKLTITLVNTVSACAVLPGLAIYIWHCDAAGHYSLYDVADQNYLRGVQVSDSNGQVTFTTVFPGCYSGRYPHIHFEVFRSLSTATSGNNSLLTSQMAMPRDVAAALYAADSAVYAGSTANLAKVTTSSDGVFGDNTAAQIAAQTPSVTGDATSGYTAAITVGLAA